MYIFRKKDREKECKVKERPREINVFEYLKRYQNNHLRGKQFLVSYKAITIIKLSSFLLVRDLRHKRHHKQYNRQICLSTMSVTF